MIAPVPATKFYVPPLRPIGVRRPQLLERLNAGLHRKWTLVSAPAGFGKTTLVAEWVTECERLTAWISLDEGDDEPRRFLTHLVTAMQAALHPVAPNVGEVALEVLQSPRPPPVETVLTSWLNDLVGLANPCILVLDDYHVIDSHSIDHALTFLLAHLPPQVHLVIATREDPRLPLARMRARDEVTMLRAEELKFTVSEAEDFLGRVMGLSLATADIARLEARTEGWIAGLQLAALSLQGHEDIPGFVRAFAGDNRYVMDYLIEEVLQRQTERTRNFLLTTSILERLSGPLCDALTGEAGGWDTLIALERDNMFLIPLDDNRQWYRYHHLFADVLRARLTETSERSSHLHLQASAWLERNGMPEEAIRHALAANDHERAADLLELVWRGMDRTFQSATWLAWAKAIPDALVRTRPVLGVGYAWALLNAGRLEAAEARLQDAEQCLDEARAALPSPITPSTMPLAIPPMVVVDEKEYRALPVTIASARAYKAQAQGDVPATLRHAAHALDLLPPDDPLGRAIPNGLLGLAHWARGELEPAYQALAESMAGFARTGNIVAALSGTFALADMRLAQGRLREAIRIYERALQLAREQAEPVVRGTAILHLGLSEAYREQGKPNDALRHFAESEALGAHDAQEIYRYRRHLAYARLRAAQGDIDGALTSLDEAARLQAWIHLPDVRPIAALKARLWLAQGTLHEASAWVRSRGLSPHDELSYLREFEYATLARVLAAWHDPRYREQGSAKQTNAAIREAEGLLVRLLELAEAEKRTGSVIELLNSQALVRHTQGDLRAALEPLEHALTLAEPEGWTRVFIGEGEPAAHLLREAAALGIMPSYVADLLAAYEAEARARSETPAPGSRLLAEPLSAREMAVLELVAQGLSNREIAERLFRSLATIKGHNRNIFGKLGVKNRTEAVARARELGLL